MRDPIGRAKKVAAEGARALKELMNRPRATEFSKLLNRPVGYLTRVGVLTGVGAVVAGVMLPRSTASDDEVSDEMLRRELKRVRQVAKKAAPKVSGAPAELPRLIGNGNNGLRPPGDGLETIRVDAKRLLRKPNIPPLARIPPASPPMARSPSPARMPSPIPRGQTVPWAWVAPLIGIAARQAVEVATRSRTRTITDTRTIPLVGLTTGNDPLTRVQPRVVPSPQSRFQPPNDYCQAKARQRRKKQRKCKQRSNVVWASGSKKGKIAGTKCQEFE